MASLLAAQPQVRENIEYGRAGATSLRMDAYVPPGTGPFPAVVIVHGGGWVRGDRRVNVQPLFRPFEEAGFAWFSISYRFATGVADAGAGIEDVQTAVRYIRRQAAEYHVNPDGIVLVGESAGAQLASMAALTSPDLRVRGVVALYSPSDLVTLVKSSEYIPAQVRKQVQGTPWEALILEGLRALSPLSRVRKDMPPFLLVHGTADSLVPFEQSERMQAAMHAAGADCELYAVKSGGHGIRWWESARLTDYKTVMVRWIQERVERAHS